MKLGIVGTGRIAGRFLSDMKAVPEVHAAIVYNPHEESAKRFAAEHGVEIYTSDLRELADRADAVYVASPHPTHYDYVKQLLLYGKHVLCEKPMVFSEEQARELFALAKENNCILMEAVKTSYCPGFCALLEVAGSGVIGRIRDVEACFSRLDRTNTREMTDVLYGGSFTEYGTYPLMAVLKLLGTRQTTDRFRSVTAANGLDNYTKADLDYGNATGLVKTGLGVKSEGQLVIAGTKGYILAKSPWWLTKQFEVRYEDPSKIDVYEYPFEGQGLRYELQAFADRIAGKEVTAGVTPEESIRLAGIMEEFLKKQNRKEPSGEMLSAVGIWAHRGCSMAYPENTLSAFEAAARLKGITGIELDVQLTKDGVPVVIHDEKTDRTTDGGGYVRDYTLEELKQLEIAAADGKTERIPTLAEVFELLGDACRQDGLLINIELKNSIYRYEGMEEKVLALVAQYGLKDTIVYSSFLPESMGLIRRLEPSAKTGILGVSMQQCMREADRQNADAVHPWIGGLDIDSEEKKALGGMKVRAWNSEEPFFGQDRPLKERRLTKYAAFGVTDIITNVPEVYLGQGME